VELGEALVSRALQTDASVELIEPEPRLTAFGIAVFLCYYERAAPDLMGAHGA
jgi:hypothetical protein